ncbi:MAG: MFS transporter [Terracidiphilus sp.]|jgi:ACS family glucarate transporter-like MFS transporter
MKPTASQNLAAITLPPAAHYSTAVASSRQRWAVICAVVAVSFLTILARVGISAAKVEMAHDLRITDLTFGLVFGAFALGYAVFMIPCGLLADRWGPRKSLALSVFFWSVFTLCTGLVSGISALLSIRFLFGLAEAGVYPQATRALHNWTLPRERGLALGLLNMGSRLGAAFGLVITPLCVVWLGWRESFVWLGIIGAIWAAIWFWWFRDRPEIKLNKHKSKVFFPGEEKSRTVANDKTPWRAFVSSRNFYLILYQYFASQFTFFICLSWLLPFLRTRYSVTTGEAGVYSSIPLYCGALAMWGGGIAVDRIYKAGKWKRSRALPAMLGFGLATAALLPAPFMSSAGGFIACFALTTIGVDLTISSSWAVCCDVGGNYSGTLSAAMNTMGAMGSFASSLLFPILISWTGNIAVYFYLAALLNIVGLACWRYIEPARSLIQEES